jgi:hypothetical protein
MPKEDLEQEQFMLIVGMSFNLVSHSEVIKIQVSEENSENKDLEIILKQKQQLLTKNDKDRPYFLN